MKVVLLQFSILTNQVCVAHKHLTRVSSIELMPTDSFSLRRYAEKREQTNIACLACSINSGPRNIALWCRFMKKQRIELLKHSWPITSYVKWKWTYPCFPPSYIVRFSIKGWVHLPFVLLFHLICHRAS